MAMVKALLLAWELGDGKELLMVPVSAPSSAGAMAHVSAVKSGALWVEGLKRERARSWVLTLALIAAPGSWAAGPAPRSAREQAPSWAQEEAALTLEAWLGAMQLQRPRRSSCR